MDRACGCLGVFPHHGILRAVASRPIAGELAEDFDLPLGVHSHSVHPNPTRLSIPSTVKRTLEHTLPLFDKANRGQAQAAPIDEFPSKYGKYFHIKPFCIPHGIW